MSETCCVHCERAAIVDRLGLCPACQAVETTRVLYVRRRGWTPAREAHLRRLTRRARARLPLFEEPPPGEPGPSGPGVRRGTHVLPLAGCPHAP